MRDSPWFDLAKSIIRGEVVVLDAGEPMDMPPLHPAEHAWVERMCGRRMTNEEAQVAIREASIAASLNYYVDGRVN
jgi:hypothetical protein